MPMFLTDLTKSTCRVVRRVGVISYPSDRFVFHPASADVDLSVPGFYFISCGGIIKHASHVGVQKKKVGFKEVVHRLSTPRTNQNMIAAIELKKCTKTSVVSVHHMSYAGVRDILGIDEYSPMNDGISMMSALRTKFNIDGRELS